MNKTLDKIAKLEIQLHSLEEKLADAYYKLGKRTQEFVESNSKEINEIVNDIITVKQTIFDLETQNKKAQKGINND